MKTKLISGLLAASLMAAPMAPALARDNHPAPRPTQRVETRHHDNGGAVAGLALGVAALTTAAILANSAPPAPQPVYYAAPTYRHTHHWRAANRHPVVYRYHAPAYVVVR